MINKKPKLTFPQPPARPEEVPNFSDIDVGMIWGSKMPPK